MNALSPFPPRFTGQFKTDTSYLEKYPPEMYAPFKTIYMDGVEAAVKNFQPVLDALPADVVIEYTPYPHGGGMDNFNIHMAQDYDGLVARCTGTNRRWIPLETPVGENPPNPFLETDAAVLKAELAKFKQWLPSGLLQLAKRVHDMEYVRLKHLTEKKGQAIEHLSCIVNSLIDRVINPLPVSSPE